MSPFGTVTLGELISLLERRDPDDRVRFDFGNTAPTHVDSYRGYYDHLAIGFTTEWDPDATVEKLLAKLRVAVGGEFTGYKGGTFRMDMRTPVWASNYGECSSTSIVGLYEHEGQTVIKTEWVA